jgi:hypothetical protein
MNSTPTFTAFQLVALTDNGRTVLGTYATEADALAIGAMLPWPHRALPVPVDFDPEAEDHLRP